MNLDDILDENQKLRARYNLESNCQFELDVSHLEILFGSSGVKILKPGRTP